MKGPNARRGIWRWVMSFPLALLLLSVAAADLQAAPFAYIGNYSDGTVSVIDTATNTVVTTMVVGGNPGYVAVHPDGTRVYITKQGTSNISVIDTATNTVGATIPLGGPNVAGIAVSPDGTQAYAVAYHPLGWPGQIAVIDTTTDTEIPPRLTVGVGPNGVAVSPDSTRVYVANQYSGTVSVIDATTNSAIATVTVGTMPLGIAVNPAGTYVYVANRNSNSVSIIDTATNTVTATVAVGTWPIGIAINPIGTRAYATNALANTLSVIDTATNTVISTVPVGAYPTGVDVNPTGTMAYVANWTSNNVSVVDTTTNTVVSTIAVGHGPMAMGRFIAGAPANRLPVADAGPDQVVECTVPGGTAVAFDGTGSSDPDGDPLSYLWTGAFGSASGATPTVSLPLGTHAATLTVTDPSSASDADTVTVQVVDTASPVITNATASPNILWPPNHKMVPVTVSVSVADQCSASSHCKIVSAAGNEPDDGIGDGSTAPDIIITGDLTVQLRAERAGNGAGRVYTLEVQCTDDSHNTSNQLVTVRVPRSQGH